jgi:thiamine-monophosphate kinase
MIDTSDGLLADLGHVAQASGVTIDIATAALDLDGPLASAAAALPPSPTGPTPATQRERILSWVLTGGEDHSMAATFPPSVALPPRWHVIGTVHGASPAHRASPAHGDSKLHGDSTAHRASPAHDSKVTIDGAPYAGPSGWQHFR